MVQKFNRLKAKQSGFTIVELLIVIVVIGILAAITIVAYSGITNRANTVKAQTNAANTQKVAEAYNADNGYYPQKIADFTGGSLSTKLPSGITVSATAPATGATALTNVQYYYCGSVASPTAAQTLGGKIIYFDSAANALATVYVGTGAAALVAGSCTAWLVTS